MSLLTDFLTFEYANAYVLSNSKQFSAPKIYDAGGDLTKRWYVYYSFRNPKTGKLERQTPIYGGANKYKTKTDRMEVLSMYRRSLHDFLKRGFNPYEDNSDLLTQFQSSDIHTENSSQKVVASAETKVEEKSRTSISDAFAQVLHIKKHVVSPSTYMNYKQKLLKLEQWLKGVLPQNATIDQITKQHIVTYLNQVLERTSARTRNNTRVELGSLFQALVDNEFIPYNFIHSINVLRTRPERHKTYSIRQQQSIYTYLEKEDSTLLLFIQFISAQNNNDYLPKITDYRLQFEELNFNKDIEVEKINLIVDYHFFNPKNNKILFFYEKDSKSITPEMFFKTGKKLKSIYKKKNFKRLIKANKILKYNVFPEEAFSGAEAFAAL